MSERPVIAAIRSGLAGGQGKGVDHLAVDAVDRDVLAAAVLLLLQCLVRVRGCGTGAGEDVGVGIAVPPVVADDRDQVGQVLLGCR